MKCSIAADLFMARLGMAVERKLEQCLKHFILWKRADVHLFWSEVWCRGVCTQQLKLLTKDLELLNLLILVKSS